MSPDSRPIVIYPDRLHEPEQRALADHVGALVRALDGAPARMDAASVADRLRAALRLADTLTAELLESRPVPTPEPKGTENDDA